MSALVWNPARLPLSAPVGRVGRSTENPLLLQQLGTDAVGGLAARANANSRLRVNKEGKITGSRPAVAVAGAVAVAMLLSRPSCTMR